MKDYYLLIIWDDVEPELEGPYPSAEARDIAARDHRQEIDACQENGLYRLEVPRGEPVQINSYGSQELEK